MVKVKCSNCGNEISDQAKFCPHCGDKVERKQFCTECGLELPKEALYCAKCGTKLLSTSDSLISDVTAEKTKAFVSGSIDKMKDMLESQESTEEGSLPIGRKIASFIGVLGITLGVAQMIGGEVAVPLFVVLMYFYLTKTLKLGMKLKAAIMSVVVVLALAVFIGGMNHKASSHHVTESSATSSSSSSSTSQPVITFRNENDVRGALDRFRFKSDDGHTITFSQFGNEITYDGRVLSSTTTIYIKDRTKALVKTYGPYGTTTFALVAHEWGGMSMCEVNSGTVFLSK